MGREVFEELRRRAEEENIELEEADFDWEE